MERITFEIPRYAQPVVPETLHVRETYFSLTFIDDEMMIPVLIPIVFLGETEDGQFLFQDAESFYLGPEAGDEPINYSAYSKQSLASVFDYESMLHGLLQCFARRRKAT
jgi:hypothetical protein